MMARKKRGSTITLQRSGRLILVLGGASSGKSTAALKLAGPKGRRAFVATAEARDDEMTSRIRRHQLDRGRGWETAEVPIEIAEWLRSKGRGYRTIVLDCLTVWLSNLRERDMTDEAVAGQVSSLITAARASQARVVVVSNELGLGLVPQESGSRKFRELMGQTNQQVAAGADEVYFVTAGILQQVK
jgi:adenosylcobinamide kinase/adenosylcobinamide-phosphate guanylyltransferase